MVEEEVKRMKFFNTEKKEGILSVLPALYAG